MFILLKNEEVGSDAEVEFTGENQMLRVKPVRWNERILCVNAPGKQNNKRNTNSCIKIKPIVKKHSALALPGLIFCVCYCRFSNRECKSDSGQVRWSKKMHKVSIDNLKGKEIIKISNMHEMTTRQNKNFKKCFP